MGEGWRKGFIAIKRMIVGYPGFRIRGSVFLLHLMLVKDLSIAASVYWLVRERKKIGIHTKVSRINLIMNSRRSSWILH